MMRIKILRTPFRRDPQSVWLAWKKAGASPGDIIDIDDDIAEKLIDWRLAIAVKVEILEEK
jgi:hypothetical protein